MVGYNGLSMRRLLNILAVLSVVLYGGGVAQFAHLTLEHVAKTAPAGPCAGGCMDAPGDSGEPSDSSPAHPDSDCTTCEFLATSVLSIDFDAAQPWVTGAAGQLVATAERRPEHVSPGLRRSRAPPAHI